MRDWLIAYFEPMREAPPWLWAVVIVFTLLVWFVPALIATVRNRAWLGPIALLNIPAGLSWIVWTALIVWAASGKGPPPDIASNAQRAWLWMGIALAVLVAAIAWFFLT